MSVQVSGEVWKYSRGLKAGAKLLLLALADWCNEEYQCWPKMPAIASKCDCDEKTASRIVGELEESGYLEVTRGGGRGRGSLYTVFPRGDRFAKLKDINPRNLGGYEPKPPQIKGDKNDQNPANKGGLNFPAYKEEPSNLNKVLTVSGGGTREEEFADVQETPPPPQARENNQTRDLHTPIRLALCEVCGLSPDTLSRRDEIEVQRITPWLLSEFEGDEMAVATAIRQRFALWNKTTPPHLSQVNDRNWRLFGRAIEIQQQPKPEVTNATAPTNNRNATSQRFLALQQSRAENRT